MIKSILVANRVLPPFLVAILSTLGATPGLSQTKTAADGPWAGWAQCRLTVQGQGYANQQTHTWVLTGTTPTLEGGFRLYPATWTVTGQGSRQRCLSAGRTERDQWTTSGGPVPAPISVWIRESDATLRITSRHAQQRSPGGTIGTSTIRAPGGSQADRTTQIALDVYEWRFPAIENVPTTSSTVVGSSTLPLAESVAPGQPPGTSSTAACSWQFVHGALAAIEPPAPPATSTGAATASPSTAVPTTLSSAGSVKPIQTVATQPPPPPPPTTTGAVAMLPPTSPTTTAAIASVPTGMTAVAAGATPGGPPAQGIRATPSDASIYVRWNCPPGASGYEVFATPKGGTQVKVTTTPISSNCPQDLSVATPTGIKLGTATQPIYATGFTHAPLLNPGSEFTYVVRTLYPSGGPADSDPVTARTNLFQPVAGVAAWSGSTGTVTVGWNNLYSSAVSRSASSYLVSRKLQGETAFKQVGTVGPLTTFPANHTYIDVGVPPGRHEYKVQAVDGEPGGPVGVSAGAFDIWLAQVNLLFIDIGFSGGWSGADVQVVTSPTLDGTFKDVTAQGWLTVASGHWHGLGDPGSKLYYKIRANYPGGSIVSEPKEVSVPVPSPIYRFSATNMDGYVRLDWQCDPAVKEYNLIRRPRAGLGVGWEYVMSIPPYPTWVVSLLKNNGELVCAYDDKTLPAGFNPLGMEYIVVGVEKWGDPIRVARTIVR